MLRLFRESVPLENHGSAEVLEGDFVAWLQMKDLSRQVGHLIAPAYRQDRGNDRGSRYVREHCRSAAGGLFRRLALQLL
ncbi:MAG: hypothetical protein ACXW3G_11240, partial [Rhodoplanes sp.]